MQPKPLCSSSTDSYVKMYRQCKEPETLVQKSSEITPFLVLRKDTEKGLGIAVCFHSCSPLSWPVLTHLVYSSLLSSALSSVMVISFTCFPWEANYQYLGLPFFLVCLSIYTRNFKKWWNSALHRTECTEPLKTDDLLNLKCYKHSTHRTPQKWTGQLSLRCHHGLKMQWQL